MIGILRFPGSNCDQDVAMFCQMKGRPWKYLWHADQFEGDFEALILPGGFSFGDYLRAGALAAKSPAMNSVASFAKKGGPVLGICNGFQILTEAGLLPGALLKNTSLRFQDEWVDLVVHSQPKFFCRSPKPLGEDFVLSDSNLPRNQLRLPIAHGQGRFYAPEDQIQSLFDRDQVWLTYRQNPNGSFHDIAGVMNLEKNVCALMPHPERAIAAWMGSMDGWGFL